MADYRTFTVLLDEPASEPALGFADYALAFSDIIVHSKPHFAIGIFGEWGSGKTTLMQATSRAVESHPSVIPVWFNACRYEREEHLIVPMLDTLREGLATWAAKQPGSNDRADGRSAAATVGRAARALAAGLSFKAAFLGASLDFDPRKAMDVWGDKQSADDPRSFYHASFAAMRDGVQRFVGSSDRRIVIFIDDLDRCLPLNALEVLESMKLFFDLEGFVFVVGLDQKVVERVFEIKLESGSGASSRASGNGAAAAGGSPAQAARPASGGDRAGPAVRAASISGTDYIKKIFQVPFGLPRISRGDLEGFFSSLVWSAEMPDDQRTELLDVVWPHLDAATGADAGSVNPREVKRLVNAYTLQMKMLSAKLGRAPNPNVVLAIQTMAFRSGWLELYELLTAEPAQFVDAVNRVLANPDQTEFYLRSEPLPSTFLAYLRGPAAPLLSEPELDVYITSAETTGSSDPQITEARTTVAQLLRLLDRLGVDQNLTEQAVVGELGSRIQELHSRVARDSVTSYFADEAERLTRAIRDRVKGITAEPQVPAGPPPWVDGVRQLLVSLDENLREMRRQSRVGAVSA